MNYVKLMNWLWENIPHEEGYKPDYAVVFLGIVDSINKNDWRETAIDFELLQNKTGVEKRMLLKARTWLSDLGYISFTSGKNVFVPAKYKLNLVVHVAGHIEVQKCTTTCTSNAPLHVPQRAPLHVPQRVPLNIYKDKPKTLNLKPKTINTLSTPTSVVPVDFEKVIEVEAEEVVVVADASPTSPPVPLPPSQPDKPPKPKKEVKPLNIPFDVWWEAYEKKADRAICEKLWTSKLTDADRESALRHTGLYVQSTPNVRFRRNPQTYLNRRSWENDIIEDVTPTSIHGHGKPATNNRPTDAEFANTIDALAEWKYGRNRS